VADTITVTYKVNEDGSLKAIGKDAEKAAKSTNKAANSAEDLTKKNKGVAGATSNGTKAFSKMTTGMQGGLVPAYAEVAARVFALTAAFGVLSRNDAISKLQEGIEFTGRAAGRNLTFVANELKRITDNAISAEAAMRATAVGVSAGFSEEQMKGLAQVAKGASLALGRDMADAMDRLIRGAAKLEPEILDELGIMVRLDKASEDYARSLNKTVGELTQFEKRMAFTNAIIEQGRQKFDGITDSIDASPFSKLSASLSDLAKTAIGGLNKALGPMANFLAENTFALGALVALYASSVAGTIVGGITSMAEASASGAVRTEAQSKAALRAIKPNVLLGKAFNTVATSSDRSAKSIQTMMKSLNMTINMTTKDTKKLKAATKARNHLVAEIYRQDLAQVKVSMTNALAILQEQGLMAGIRAHAQALRELSVATTTAMSSQTTLYAIMTAGKGVMLALGSTVRFLGAAFLTMMPYIGMALAAFAILGPIVTKMFGLEDTRLEKQIEKNAKRFEEFDEVLMQYNKTILKSKTSTDLWAKTLKPISGLLTEVAQAMHETIAAAQTEQLLKHVAAVKQLAQAESTLAAATGPGISGVYYRGKTHDTNTMESNVADAKKLKESTSGELSSMVQEMISKDLIKGMSKFLSTSDAMVARLKILGEQGAPVGDALNAIKASQEGVNDTLTKLLSGEYTPKQAAEQMTILATSATASVQAFESFNDILNKAKDLVGDTTSTWGTYGKHIDNVKEAVVNVNKILEDGKGSSASKEKANLILRQYGLVPGDNPVAQLSAFQSKLEEINAAYKNLELKEAQDALNDTSAIATGITILQNLETRVALKEQEISVAIKGSEQENILLLQKLAIQKEISGELDKQAQKVAERATRLGGEIFGESFTAAEGYADYSAENPDAKTSEKMGKLNELAQPQLKALSALSPEGALMSSAIEGALILSESFNMAFEDINAGGDKMQIGLEVAAAGLNVISGMMAAQSKAQVASIDKQIEAEKKRDGNSKASVDKIKALEKKKDDIKRKAFEKDKKLKMAQVMIATASAVMKSVEESPATFGLPFSAFAVAMGAAQLAAIAGTSYQGGGGAASAGGPSKVAVGSRNNSVDLARARSPSGELGYARGQSGTGQGMTNFRPTGAFAGYKHRAGGGYIVGEQGPEVFMPETPGEIIPSGQGTGGTTNVNFSINAVDAAGIEDLLMNQRGNIIGMIRESANAHGETFLEGINTMSGNEGELY